MSAHKIGQNIKRLLTERGWSANELAHRSDIGSGTLHAILTHKTTKPHPRTLKAIAGAFGITLEQLRGTEPLPGDEPTPLEYLPTGLAHLPVHAVSASGRITDQVEDVMQLPSALLSDGHKGTCYAVVASTDLLADWDVERGDYIVICPKHKITSGAMAVIEVDGKHALRRLSVGGGMIIATSASPAIPPIPITESDVLGVVRGRYTAYPET